MKLSIIFLFLIMSSCAQLHHVQVGEIESHASHVQKPFEILISETGVNIQEIGRISRAASRNSGNNDLAKATAILGLFQMGPVTGNPVYVNNYAKNLMQVIYEKCPSGKVTGLMSIRETRKYPVISGEIIKVTGYCLIPKEG